MSKVSAEEKRAHEKALISEMIRLYCKKKHGTADELCEDCRTLYDYALARIEHCPMMEHKTFCSRCPVHCYRPEMREKIRAVMRFSGPRMLFHHPLEVVRHALSSLS